VVYQPLSNHEIKEEKTTNEIHDLLREMLDEITHKIS